MFHSEKSLSRSRSDGVPVEIIELEEELCARTMSFFKERVESAINCDRPNVVVDFKKTRVLDSVGLETLLWVAEELQLKGGFIKVAGLNATLRKVFEITQIERFFEIYDNVAAASRSYD